MKAAESDSTPKLRRCPFCGRRAELSPMPRTQEWWRVQCEQWQCGGTTWAMSPKQAAIEAWNRRAGDDDEEA